MKSIENLKWRYATKKFDPSYELTETQVNSLVEIFNLTATSYGLQPVRLHVIQDRGLQEKMVGACYGQRQVADAAVVFVLSTIDATTEYIENYFSLVKELRNTPDEILNPYKNHLIEMFKAKSKEERAAWAKNQAYIILGSLMSACADERLDSCPMEGFVPAQIDELLDLNRQGQQSVLLFTVGKRAADDMFANFAKVRRPVDELVSFKR
jgi:nitroreductase